MTRKPRQQCNSCPWRLENDPADIPDGFNYEVHRRLGAEIRETATHLGAAELHIQACHSTPEKGPGQKPCVGWLVNQMGVGGNLMLRIRAMRNDGFADVQTVGQQRESYDEIIPTTHGDPTCTHQRSKPGLRLGSNRSEICCDCGAFRRLAFVGDRKSPWKPWERYLALVNGREA